MGKCIDCLCGKNFTIEGSTCGLCTDEQEMDHYIERASVVLGDCFEDHELERFFLLLRKLPDALKQLCVLSTKINVRNYEKLEAALERNRTERLSKE